MSRFSPDIQQAMKDGVNDWDADLAGVMKLINTDQLSSGDMFGTRDFLKGNYLYRYAGAKLGLYGNSKQDAIYFGYFVDANHQPLDASKSSYELHFAKGDLPTTKAFWSLTMYDGKTQLLVANPAKRYLLNSTTLKSYQYGADGSLIFHYLYCGSWGCQARPTGCPRLTDPSTVSFGSTFPATRFSTEPGRSHRCNRFRNKLRITGLSATWKAPDIENNNKMPWRNR